MKKIVAILCLLLLFMQAIPVLHLFAPDPIAFAVVDEDKPSETKIKEKKDGKEFLHCYNVNISKVRLQQFSCCNHLSALPAPFLESFTPPPDALA